MQTNWIDREISTGLQKLILLSLDRTPALDIMHGVVDAWVEAITAGRVFDETRDAPRFKTAFRALAQHCNAWPSPKEFLETLPRLESEPQLNRVESAQSRLMGMKAMAEIAQLLGINQPSDDSENAK